MVLEVDIPWLKRFDEPKPEEPDDELEQVDYEVMLQELEFR